MLPVLGSDWLPTRSSVVGATLKNEFVAYTMQGTPLKRHTRRRFTVIDSSDLVCLGWCTSHQYHKMRVQYQCFKLFCRWMYDISYSCYGKVDTTIPYMMETQMHTAGTILGQYSVRCGRYYECHVLDGDVQIQSCVLHLGFHLKRNCDFDLVVISSSTRVQYQLEVQCKLNIMPYMQPWLLSSFHII